jgi:hypothetical protein
LGRVRVEPGAWRFETTRWKEAIVMAKKSKRDDRKDHGKKDKRDL